MTRTSSPLARQTPIPRKRATKRKWKTPRCIGWSTDPARKSLCKQPQQHIQRCRKHADWHLDQLVRDLVALRPERCEVPHPFPCFGRLVVNHGLDRDEKSVRWDPRNVIRGCDSLNGWAKNNKRKWYAMFAKHIGAVVYRDLERIADDPPKLDYDAVLAELSARLRELREAA